MAAVIKILRTLSSPQLLVVVLAIFACAAGQAGRGFSVPQKVEAAASLMPVQAAYEEPLPPETGLQLSPKPLTFTYDCNLYPCLTLTFDDGPNPETTPVIIEALEKAGAKATFFVLGSRIAGNEAILQRMEANGFEIGNHSWSHHKFTESEPQEMLEEVNKTHAALIAAGVTPAAMFRPPYGDHDHEVRSTLPMPIVLWNIDPRDWQAKDPHQLADLIESQARPGGIIVMHDTQAVTAAVAADLIERLSRRFLLVTLSDLVQIPYGARADTVIH